MTSTSQGPEQRPLLLAWVATVLTIVIFGGILLLMLTSRSPAAVGGSGAPNNTAGLSSAGEGRTTAAPDLAQVTLGVQSEAAAPADAATDSAKKSTAIVMAIKVAGVKEADIQTTSVNLSPQLSFKDNGISTVQGYLASETLQVTVRSIDQVAGIISDSLKAGATDVQGVFYTFTPETLRKLEDTARQSAVQDAQRRATVLAQLSNVRLGKPITVSESLQSPSQPPPIFASANTPLAGGGTVDQSALQPGSLEVVSHVEVKYEIL